MPSTDVAAVQFVLYEFTLTIRVELSLTLLLAFVNFCFTGLLCPAIIGDEVPSLTTLYAVAA